MAKLLPGFYAECIECGSFTPMNDAKADAVCGPCQDNGADDPYITQVVEVTECHLDPDECGSEDHHFGIKMHVTEVEA